MVGVMQKKIIYFVDIYEPVSEGISKEVCMLHSHFKESFIYGMNPFFEISSLFRMKVNTRKLVFCTALIPLRATKKILERKFDLSHVFGNLYGDYFVTTLEKRPILLTAVTIDKIGPIKDYEKIDEIIVESEKQKKMLLNAGVDKNKVKLVYPGIDLKAFSHSKPNGGEFSILFASSPLREEYFGARGVNLLLDAAKALGGIKFILLWRKRAVRAVKMAIEEKRLKNIKLVNEIIHDMNKMYGNAHATIAPFTTREYNKSCPNSIPESLAAGKPVLVSDNVGISDLVKKEKCGVVFKPILEELVNAVNELKQNYKKYQKNARKTAEKYFSKETFLEEYKKIYEKHYIS